MFETIQSQVFCLKIIVHMYQWLNRILHGQYVISPKFHHAPCTSKKALIQVKHGYLSSKKRYNFIKPHKIKNIYWAKNSSKISIYKKTPQKSSLKHPILVYISYINTTISKMSYLDKHTWIYLILYKRVL